jgi:DNA polymerase (family X)
MNKPEIAAVLEDVAAMLELKGENPFRVRAYQNGARALLNDPQDLALLVKENRLTDIKGIGKGLAENITSLVTTGKLPFYEELKKTLHPGLVELIRIQGVGPKKAVVLYEKLGIKDLPGLEKAAKEGKIAKLKGFGQATQDNILKGISFHAEHAAQFLIDDAQETAERVLSELKKLPQIIRISVCGSLRRHKEVVRDVDVLVSAAADDVKTIMKRFTCLPGVTRVLGQGDTKSSILFHNGLQADLRIVTDDQFPFALHYFTGSKEHNIVMRQRAIARKMKLNEYGLVMTDGSVAVPCKDEAELFEKLGLQYIPPELREDRGEFAAAEKRALPRLVEVGDLCGVFHVHSNWSDGTVALEEMIAEAERMGFDYVGISDHSQIAGYAGGLSPERVREQGKAIAKLRKRFKIHIFWGSECDILKDGAMDYDDKILAAYDFVIASVHSFFKMPEKEMTARIIKALKNRYVTHLGHITGRLLLRREPYALNVQEALKAAAGEGVAVEINALPDRLELDWREIPKAKALGCQFSCNPDAHSKGDLHGFGRAVGIARKGWLTKEDVVNALSLKDVTAFLRSRR